MPLILSDFDLMSNPLSLEANCLAVIFTPCLNVDHGRSSSAQSASISSTEEMLSISFSEKTFLISDSNWMAIDD